MSKQGTVGSHTVRYVERSYPEETLEKHEDQAAAFWHPGGGGIK